MLEPTVIALGGGEDSRKRGPQRIKGNNVGRADGWHVVCVRRGVGVGKGLTVG
jgi:hypothetical protein